MSAFNRNIVLTEYGDELYPNDLNSVSHGLTVITKHPNLNGGNNGCLAFPSFFALYQFGLFLAHEAAYDAFYFREFYYYDDFESISSICFSPYSERLFIGCEEIGEYNNLAKQFTLSNHFSDMFSADKLQLLQKGISTTVTSNDGLNINFSSELIMYQFGIFLLWHAAYEKNFKSDWLEIYKTRVYFFNPEFYF